MSRVDLIYTTEGGGRKKTRRLAFVNPELDDAQLADIAAALNGLSDNELQPDIYRLEKGEIPLSKEVANLKLDPTIRIPDTVTAIWQGGGELSVSLENDIADYTIDGGNVYFEPKKMEAGEYSARGAIIIGENDDFDSDCAEFTVAFTSTKTPVPKQRLYSGLHSIFNKTTYNDTICWVGGDFVTVTPVNTNSVAVSVTCGACVTDTLSGLHQLPVTYYASLKSGAYALYANFDLKTTTATYNIGKYLLTSVVSAGNNNVGNRKVNATYTNNCICNAASNCHVVLPSGRADGSVVVNYGSNVAFTSPNKSGADNAYIPANYISKGDSNCFNMYGYIYYGNIDITSEGDFCQFLFHEVTKLANIKGNHNLIVNTSAQSTITGNFNLILSTNESSHGLVKGDYCYLKGAGTLAAQSDYCTICAGGNQYLNGNDVIFGVGSATGKVYDMGDNSTIVYSGASSISGDDLILTSPRVTIYGAAENNFTWRR